MTVAAERSNLAVLELSPQPDSTLGVFGIVNVFARLEGNTRGVAAFLAELESGTVVLSVERLLIRRADNTPVFETPGVVRLEVGVQGLFLSEEGS